MNIQHAKNPFYLVKSATNWPILHFLRLRLLEAEETLVKIKLWIGFRV